MLGATLISISAWSQLETQNPAETILGTFRNTYYYIAYESDYRNAKVDTTILDMQDRILAQVSTPFKKSLAMEGTGKLLDGRVVNFAGRKNGETRYRFTQSPYGDGIGVCQLMPFRTIAVDPSRIPLGSLVRIDETVGMVLPDGTVHDGLWRAEDIGSAIKGDRIDIFIGTKGDSPVLARQGITHLRPLTLRMVEPPGAQSCANFSYELDGGSDDAAGTTEPEPEPGLTE
ncbi:MAG: 3D domain-containing protein [Oligoflexia bacterium]|nr:3D domain-containing protein [Oligoflexia bacterium]